MALPFGWAKPDIDIAAQLFASYGADPQDGLAIWFSESGLKPRNSAQAGVLTYYGLIMGTDEFVTKTAGMQAGAWIHIVEKESVATQLAAIQRFWDALIRIYLHASAGNEGDTLIARAERLGITNAGFLYAMQFVPAFMAHAKTADEQMIKEGVLYDGQDYYTSNPGFDITHKGYISPRDMDLRISRFRDRANADPEARTLMATIATSEAGFIEEVRNRATESKWGPVLTVFAVTGTVLGGIVLVDRFVLRR